MDILTVIRAIKRDVVKLDKSNRCIGLNAGLENGKYAIRLNLVVVSVALIWP